MDKYELKKKYNREFQKVYYQIHRDEILKKQKAYRNRYRQAKCGSKNIQNNSMDELHNYFKSLGMTTDAEKE